MSMSDEHEDPPEGAPPCVWSEDEHGFSLNVQFFLNEHGDHMDVSAAQINSHLHNTPAEPVVQTLLSMAITILEDNMIQNLPEEMPESIRRMAASGMAQMYVRKVLDNLPDITKMSAFVVPDDLSGLLGD